MTNILRLPPKKPELPNCNGYKFLDNHVQKAYSQARLEKYGLAMAAWARAVALEDAAKVCDSVNSYDNPMPNYDNPVTATDCADAIRSMK